MAERRRTAKRVDPTPRPGTQQASESHKDDPFGRQVFFSSTPRALPASGNGRIRAECSSCGATRRMTVVDVARAHFPVWAWIPVMRNSHWMRCPACSERTWIRLSPIFGSD